MATKKIDVFAPGSKVLIADMPATVVAVCVRGETVSYELVWWDGKARKSDWLYSHEVHSGPIKDSEKLTIGFKH